MTPPSREHILEEEVLIVRHSGELPEVVYHSSLVYLCEDPEGPHFRLTQAELQILQRAAKERYLEIVCRDLDPNNRDLSLFRGMERAYVNWQRFVRFCERIQNDASPHLGKVATCLTCFLQQELVDVTTGKRTSSLNCSPEIVIQFAELLGLGPEDLPSGWQSLAEPEIKDPEM
ncbi:hypothetical protein [Desulfogranum japonicum]|uniref:hypothetical protein n=1 Tax=Desulfogranum japonicum TaxID=231447 RepID=UPI00048CAFF3|nr:hypothetical protein [Desulfogranum japonicum]